MGVALPRVTFVDVDGSRRDVDAAANDTLMSAAVKHGVTGIVAECGGNSTCATCHVYVEERFYPLVGEPNDLEEDMLDLAVTHRLPTSRLSCQIVLGPELDGLTVRLPSEQP